MPKLSAAQTAGLNATYDQLRSRVNEVVVITSSVNSTLKDVHQLQSELDAMKPISLVKGRLDRAYDLLGEQTTEEIRRIDQAIASIDSLMVLQDLPNESTPTASSTPSGNKRGPYKKRKMELSSSAPSPLPSGGTSPIPLSDPPHPMALPRQSSSKTFPGQPPAPSSSGSALPSPGVGPPNPGTPSSGATMYRKLTSKGRKDALASQLPLASGRQVAFRQPIKVGSPEEWILARIVTCIQGDKNRYAVEDVDYDPTNPTPEQGKYNTTLKSIVPLPDPRERAKTYPEHEYPRGTQVIGLYPETTSFYRATVESGPDATSEKTKKRERVYRLRFDDDGDEIRPVPVELVVEVP